MLWLSFSVSKLSNAVEARGKREREIRAKGERLWRWVLRLRGFVGLGFDGMWVGMGVRQVGKERLDGLLQQIEEEAMVVAAMEMDEADIWSKQNGETNPTRRIGAS